MANKILQIKQGYQTDFSVTLKDSKKNVLDLSVFDGIRFYMIDCEDNIIIDSVATFVDKANGQVKYDFQAVDVATAGRYKAYFGLTISGIKKLAAPTHYFDIDITQDYSWT